MGSKRASSPRILTADIGLSRQSDDEKQIAEWLAIRAFREEVRGNEDRRPARPYPAAGPGPEPSPESLELGLREPMPVPRHRSQNIQGKDGGFQENGAD